MTKQHERAAQLLDKAQQDRHALGILARGRNVTDEILGFPARQAIENIRSVNPSMGAGRNAKESELFSVLQGEVFLRSLPRSARYPRRGTGAPVPP